MTGEFEAANKELLRGFYKEVYVDWNMEFADQVLSPRFISHDWPEGGPRGPGAFRDYYSAIRSAISDARYEIDDLVAEGDRVVVRWRMLGTHEGAFGDIPASGKSIVLKHRHIPGRRRPVDGAMGRVRPVWRAGTDSWNVTTLERHTIKRRCW